MSFPPFSNVPYIHVERLLPDGTKIQFNSNRTVSEMVDFQDVYGISRLNTKVSVNGFFATLEIPISQQMAINPALQTVLEKITSFDGKWKCSFGWVGPTKKTIKTFEAKLASSDISVNRGLPGYDLKINLQSTYDSALMHIPIGLCTTAREYVKTGIQTNNLTISGILDRLLDDCRRAVSTNFVNLKPTQTYKDFLSSPKLNYVLDPLYNLDKENIAYSLTEDDIPKLEDIIFTIVLSDDQSSEDIKNALLDANVPNVDSVQDITKPEYQDSINVWQYLVGILNENDFLVYPAPWEDKGAKIGAFLNQNLSSGKVREVEFDGSFKKRVGNDRLISTFRNPIDVLSPNNGIISINVSTDSGENTLGSITALQELISEGQPIGQEGAAYQSNKAKTSEYKANKSAQQSQLSLYDIWLRQSKKLSMDLYGNPDIFIWDNLNISMFGKLFSGLYKISAIEHTIDASSFITSVESYLWIEGTTPLQNLQDPKTTDYTYYDPEVVPEKTESAQTRIERKTLQGKPLNWTDFGK